MFFSKLFLRPPLHGTIVKNAQYSFESVKVLLCFKDEGRHRLPGVLLKVIKVTVTQSRCARERARRPQTH